MAGACLSGYGLVKSDVKRLLTGIGENQKLCYPVPPGEIAGSVIRIAGEYQGHQLHIRRLH